MNPRGRAHPPYLGGADGNGFSYDGGSTMKHLKWLLVLALALGLLTGCFDSGDDDGDDSGPTGPSDGDELPQMYYEIVAEGFMLANLESSFDYESDAVGALEDGYLYYVMTEDFTGPDSEGWYSYYFAYSSGSETFKIRWTPDIWADDTADTSKVEIVMIDTIYADNSVLKYEFSSQYESSAKTHVTGSMSMTIDYGAEHVVWSLSWDNVSVDTEDYSGNYTGSGRWDMDTAGLDLTDISTEATLASDGSGTGKGYYNGAEIARFTFSPVVNDEQTVTYTLASENWSTQHTYEIWR